MSLQDGQDGFHPPDPAPGSPRTLALTVRADKQQGSGRSDHVQPHAHLPETCTPRVRFATPLTFRASVCHHHPSLTSPPVLVWTCPQSHMRGNQEGRGLPGRPPSSGAPGLRPPGCQKPLLTKGPRSAQREACDCRNASSQRERCRANVLLPKGSGKISEGASSRLPLHPLRTGQEFPLHPDANSREAGANV